MTELLTPEELAAIEREDKDKTKLQIDALMVEELSEAGMESFVNFMAIHNALRANRTALLKHIRAMEAQNQWNKQTICILRHTIKNMKDRPFISVHTAVKRQRDGMKATIGLFKLLPDKWRLADRMDVVIDRVTVTKPNVLSCANDVDRILENNE